ncbi:MAG: hypothetical protein IKT67_11875 [Lachnospiraceae bacterium]|nr:hypothetical protein [Lachnospiraceae bacterium]
MLLKGFNDFSVVILPNDKVRDSEILIKTLSGTHFDYVLSFGQRPSIKDKVHIETTARDGELRRDTAFDGEKLRLLFEQNDIPTKLSHNAGTSFCNCLYWGVLKFIEEKELDTKMVFVHVPFIKNIGDFELFRQRIYNTIKLLEGDNHEHHC